MMHEFGRLSWRQIVSMYVFIVNTNDDELPSLSGGFISANRWRAHASHTSARVASAAGGKAPDVNAPDFSAWVRTA
eukprot:scaffold318212_cov37-Tisochrysis_lutea.AAC.1